MKFEVIIQKRLFASLSPTKELLHKCNRNERFEQPIILAESRQVDMKKPIANLILLAPWSETAANILTNFVTTKQKRKNIFMSIY